MFGIPWLVIVFVSLGLILVINRLSGQLTLAVAIGAVFLGFLSGHAPPKILLIAWERFASVQNLFLMLVIFQVIGLSRQMSKTNLMQEMVELIRRRFSTRMAMAVLPAVIGFLPMPGGALFSAPMVDDCDPKKCTAPMSKTIINYWFRHIWEFWWPLYPGVLLAMALTGLDAGKFMLIGFPLSIFSFIGGYFFLLRKVEHTNDTSGTSKSFFRRLFLLILPIVVVVIGYAAVQFLFPRASEFSNYLPMSCGLIGAAIVLQIQRPLDKKAWKEILLNPQTLSLALLVATVRIYGAYIEARLPDGILLAEHIRMELDAWGIPVWAMYALIPFLSGITSGIAVGFVGASFPVVMSLLGANPSLRELLSTTVLAYGAGYLGMMLSPVHVCLVVTNQYFKTRLSQSLGELLKPAAVVALGVVVMVFVFRLL